MKNLKHFISALALTFFLFIAFGCMDEGTQKQTHESPTTTQTQAELTPIEKIQTDKNLTQAQKDSLIAIEKAKEIEIRKSQTISSTDLVAMYEANSVKADIDFKNKTFYVEGKIVSIGKEENLDGGENVYVTLEGNSLTGVDCYINDKYLVANLSEGDFITVLGTCKGRIWDIQMKSCEVVENLPEL